MISILELNMAAESNRSRLQSPTPSEEAVGIDRELIKFIRRNIKVHNDYVYIIWYVAFLLGEAANNDQPEEDRHSL